MTRSVNQCAGTVSFDSTKHCGAGNVQSRDLLYHGAERLPFPFVTLAEIRYLFMGLVRFPLPVVAATSLSVAVSNKAVKLRDQPAQTLSDSVQLIRRSFG